ncbi:hypothetical protein [Pseudovibrio ascidiaceicola]|uniref:hypothetical protein n=1 Tax=Pseudovibrio ascidiaceicola TaxID=285279 RepID=UPI000D699DFD|nr:hypothetical protein [Pseudovibrio ascidiaceicola]
MSLTGDISNLVGRADALITAFEQKEAGIEQQVQAAIAAVPENTRILYLNQQTGNDSNNGVAADRPLRSLEKIYELTGAGRAVEVRNLADYTFPTRRCYVPLNSTTYFRSWNGLHQLNLGIHQLEDGAQETWDWEVGGFYSRTFGTASILIYETKIAFPTAPPNGTLSPVQYSSLWAANEGSSPTMRTLKIAGCEIERPIDGVGAILGAVNSGAALAVTGCVYDASAMAGNWISTISAGTRPADVETVLCNLTSL